MNPGCRGSAARRLALLAGAGLAVAACGAGGHPAAASAPPGSPRTAAEKAATLNWLDQTNQMRTAGNFSALDQVTTGAMRTVYQVERSQGPAVTASALLAPGRYTADLARVLTRAMTGTQPTPVTAAPFAVNGFLAGPGSVNGQAATWIRQDQRAGVSFSGHFTPAKDPTFALPLASGRGYWLIGFLTQTTTRRSPSGLRAASWPDSSPVASPRPAVVHHETDTDITTYTALDPLRSAGGTVTLDGFFGWPLAAAAS